MEKKDEITRISQHPIPAAPYLADHLSREGFRISRTTLWRMSHSPPDFFVWQGGRVVAKFSGVRSAATITYGHVDAQLTAIARQYGTVSSAVHDFQGDPGGPDVTGKAVAGMTFRNVLVAVLIVLFLVLRFGWIYVRNGK